jgi:hypothetical protein
MRPKPHNRHSPSATCPAQLVHQAQQQKKVTTPLAKLKEQVGFKRGRYHLLPHPPAITTTDLKSLISICARRSYMLRGSARTCRILRLPYWDSAGTRHMQHIQHEHTM